MNYFGLVWQLTDEIYFFRDSLMPEHERAIPQGECPVDIQAREPLADGLASSKIKFHQADLSDARQGPKEAFWVLMTFRSGLTIEYIHQYVIHSFKF